MVELDREAQAETVVGIETDPLVVLDVLHRLLHAQEAFRRLLFLDAGRLQQKDEGCGAAVEDRDLRGVHIDVEVVDAKPGQRRHQVLDGADLGAATLKSGTHPGVDHGIGVAAELDRRVEIDAAEHDAGIGRGRPQHQIDLAATVQTDAGGTDQGLQRALTDHRSHLSRMTA